jgi:hypothetical protein
MSDTLSSGNHTERERTRREDLALARMRSCPGLSFSSDSSLPRELSLLSMLCSSWVSSSVPYTTPRTLVCCHVVSYAVHDEDVLKRARTLLAPVFVTISSISEVNSLFRLSLEDRCCVACTTASKSSTLRQAFTG